MTSSQHCGISPISRGARRTRSACCCSPAWCCVGVHCAVVAAPHVHRSAAAVCTLRTPRISTGDEAAAARPQPPHGRSAIDQRRHSRHCARISTANTTQRAQRHSPLWRRQLESVLSAVVRLRFADRSATHSHNNNKHGCSRVCCDFQCTASACTAETNSGILRDAHGHEPHEWLGAAAVPDARSWLRDRRGPFPRSPLAGHRRLDSRGDRSTDACGRLHGRSGGWTGLVRSGQGMHPGRTLLRALHAHLLQLPSGDAATGRPMHRDHRHGQLQCQQGRVTGGHGAMHAVLRQHHRDETSGGQSKADAA